MDFEYKIEEELGVISSGARGWTKELNLISYNGAKAKLDIRDWAPERAKMGKGVTLSKEEAEVLYDLLGKYLGK